MGGDFASERGNYFRNHLFQLAQVSCEHRVLESNSVIAHLMHSSDAVLSPITVAITPSGLCRRPCGFIRFCIEIALPLFSKDL